jgi:hypothetical protein
VTEHASDPGEPVPGDGRGTDEDPARPVRRWPWVLLVLLALVVGAGAGWSLRAAATPVGAPAAAPPASPVPAPGVPCPAAADAGAAITAQLQRAVGAVRDFDPRVLQDVLDEVQRQQDRLRAAVAACRGVPPPG